MSTSELQPDLSLIMKHVYLGSMWATAANILEEYNIGYIVRCVGGRDETNMGVIKMVYPMDDTGRSDISDIVTRNAKFIDDAYDKCVESDRAILFHCSAGVNRSSALLIAWIMHKFRMDLRDAHCLVSQRREKVCIHDKYMEQLREWDNKLFGVYSTYEGELLTTSIAVQNAIDKILAQEQQACSSLSVQEEEEKQAERK
jgi:protein-tyrosine phosphatase